jgi:hypothetical protein
MRDLNQILYQGIVTFTSEASSSCFTFSSFFMRTVCLLFYVRVELCV